jgi:hypothetical protein
MAMPFLWDVPPLWYSVVISIFCTALIFHSYYSGLIGILVLIYWIVLMVPYIHLMPYVFFNFGVETEPMLWEVFVNPYMLDEKSINLASAIGSVAAMGFTIAMYLANLTCKGEAVISKIHTEARKTLPLNVWFAGWVLAILLSWFSSGDGTIFTEKSSIPLSYEINFASAWLLSYAFLTFLFSDAVGDQLRLRRYVKLFLLCSTVTFIIIFLQLLKGDREAVPFIFGLVLIYCYWGVGGVKPHFNWRFIVIGMILLYFASMITGFVRSNSVGVVGINGFLDLVGERLFGSDINISKILHGTWSAVLLTDLSVAGDEVYGLLPINYGGDYVNLAMSLIPGFIADMIGYVRPVDSHSGVAWQMRYGIGGVHATVLPYLNFRLPGVFLITGIWTYLIVIIEKKAVTLSGPISMALLGMLVTCAPHWIWYGEKLVLNTIIMWALIAFLYRHFSVMDSNVCISGK